MARRGKIARLPRDIREQLNRRLEDGEQAVRLAEWLNSLPEVKAILATDFENRPINEVNLTDWKQGGFLEWQSHRYRATDLQESRAHAKELAEMTDGVANDMEILALARYTITLANPEGEITEEQKATLQTLGQVLRDVVRFRRCEQTCERTQIQRETLELKRQVTEDGQRKKFLELANDPKILEKLTPKMSWEEKARIVREILFPKQPKPPEPPKPPPS